MVRFGLEKVENFLDACLSLQNLVDVHAPGICRRALAGDGEDENPAPRRLPAKSYMDAYINPADYLIKQRQKLDEARERRKCVPEEAYYFAPQRQTKIMNEGWASYVHSHIMTRRALQPGELIDYAEHHAGTMATSPGRLNPYKIGLELLRDIEDRWNRGAFGPEYEQCDDLTTRRNWDLKWGLGREKLFEVRRIYNDFGFIDNFLTEDFAREHRLFAYDYNARNNNYEISSREFLAIKRQLLFQLTNFGQPIVEVVDSNHENRQELYLVHRHEGIDLDVPYAQETLKNLHTLWGRPVLLETRLNGKGRVLFSHGPDGGRQLQLAES